MSESKQEPPKGDKGESFDSLMRKLVQVPKAEVEAADRAWRKARKRKKKPKDDAK